MIRQKYTFETLKSSKPANMGRDYQVCSAGVLDTIANAEIQFDGNGKSNYFHEYNAYEKERSEKYVSEQPTFDDTVQFLKKEGNNKKYDCILGVSGGVDSSYLALLAKKAGLRVLCIHFDNGWNSELAVDNIQSIIQHCEFDLHTFVIDWNEFKDIQLSYFKAGVIDLEAVTDIAIFAALNDLSRKYKIPHILDGRNGQTEFVLPSVWINKDAGNLRNIHSQFGIAPIKNYPIHSPLKGRFLQQIHTINNIPLLEMIDYNKDKAKAEIQTEFGWRDYGGKHYESVFTRFYQGYILPEKFNVDKRKAHLSNLIYSKQMTREEALAELQNPIYPMEQLEIDFPFVLKKLDFTESSFYEYIDAPVVEHSVYGKSIPIDAHFPILKPAKFLWNKLRR